jgi:hypothetical protein
LHLDGSDLVVPQDVIGPNQIWYRCTQQAFCFEA